MAPNLNGPPTTILIKGARAPLIQFLPTNLNGPPTIIVKWAPNNNVDPGGPGPGHGMEWKMKWNGNFGLEYGRCHNGMERKISRMEWKTIFHTFIPIPY